MVTETKDALDYKSEPDGVHEQLVVVRCTCESYWHHPREHDASCPVSISPQLGTERARLEREVIEKAKAYGRAARATEDHMKTANETQESSAEGWRLLRDLESTWEDLMLHAVENLLEFEVQEQ